MKKTLFFLFSSFLIIIILIESAKPNLKQNSYYELLGIKKESTTKEIQKAFRTLSRKYKPDKIVGNKEAELEYRELYKAYQVLSNPKLKEKYDKNELISQEDFKDIY